MAEEEQTKVERIHSEIPEKKRLIYAIQCGERGPIKFGMTDNDPVIRLDYMQTSNPEKLWLVGYTSCPQTGSPSNLDIERAIHALCAKYHIRGEWFAPSCLVLSVANLLGDEMGFQYLMAILSSRVSVEAGPISYPEDWRDIKQWAYRNKP